MNFGNGCFGNMSKGGLIRTLNITKCALSYLETTWFIYLSVVALSTLTVVHYFSCINSNSCDGKETFTNLERCGRIMAHSYFSCACFSTHIHTSFELSFYNNYSTKSHLEDWMEDTSLSKTLNHNSFYTICTFRSSVYSLASDHVRLCDI